MGIFSFFRKSEPLEPIELSRIGIDMHSHFIPGIDDGAKTMKDSIELLRSMEELGYRKAITTPHIMSDFFRNTPEIIRTGLEQVQREARNAGLQIEVEAAAEYYFDYELESKIEKGGVLTFGDNYFLFEVSYMNPPDNLESFIFNLQTSGYKPILAHPERYPFWFTKTLEKFGKLKDKGVLFQLNINSLTGHYSIESKRVAEQMIEKGWYEFAGSDCHHAGHIELLKKVRMEPSLRKLIESGKLRNSSL